MERLSGLDAGFLYMETPTLLMHTLKLAILEPPVAVDALPLEWVRERIADRLHLLPPFRRRLVEVPFGLHHPLWIEDPDFDLEYHVRRVQVPPPGTPAQMDRVVAELASRPLDRRRPLWELSVLNGLEGGRIAVLIKIHHAAADGVAAAALLANVMATDVPASLEPGRPATPWRPEPVPTPWALVRDALADQARQWRRLPELLHRTVARVVALVRHKRGAPVRTPVPMLSTPRTRFGAALTPHRSFATCSLPFADLRLVKDAFEVTINDVFLAIVAGALRSWLADHGELPARPLVAGVPVSTDRPDEILRLGGNRVSNMFTTLATDEADPAQRLATIHRTTAEAKVVQNLLGAEMMADWVQYTPGRPYSWVVRQWSRHGVADQLPAPINVVVSNVPGPRTPLFAGSARLDAIFSVGPILEGVGLNITGWSYGDDLHVGLLACREHLDDPHEVTDRLRGALDELVALATVDA